MDAHGIDRRKTALHVWTAAFALGSALACANAPPLPVKSVAEFVAYARANPGKLDYGFVGTGSTPQEPETRALFFAQGYEPAGGSPEDFQRVLANDIATWSDVIRTANIKFE